MDPDDLRNDFITDAQFRALQRDNPKALFRVLEEIHQHFFFGIEDHREDESNWGGRLRLLINRNLTLHLVDGFTTDMLSEEELPQFCVMPDENRGDQTVRTSIDVEGEEVKGAIFYVDPFEFDGFVRDAIRISEEYRTWDAIPDAYYLDTDLVRFVRRVVLEEEVVSAERKFDFRLGFVGGAAPPPPAGEPEPSAEELIQAYEKEHGKIAE